MAWDDVPELDQELVQAFILKKRHQDALNKIHLYHADTNCDHFIVEQWSGVKCAKCPGWYCA